MTIPWEAVGSWPVRALVAGGGGRGGGAARRAPAAGAELDWRALIACGYGLLAAGFLVRLTVGHLALARLWRRAHPAPPWAEGVFRQLAGPVRPRAELRVSARP